MDVCVNRIGTISRSDAEEGAEGGVGRSAAVESEDELVEIGLQVRASKPVIDAECPGFEVGEDAMNPDPMQAGDGRSV